jgi:carboxymethylenebutenolidase
MSMTQVPGTVSAPALNAYVAVPAVGDGPWPGVVVLHEAFGLNDDTRQQADRLASAGYLAVAPDLFTNGGALRCLKSTFAAMTSGQGKAVDDITAVRTWLAERDDCTGKVGVIGFCMGGGFALLSANQGFEAASVNYGAMPPKDLDAALTGACPVVGSYGGRDRQLRGVAGRIEAVLESKDVPHDLKEYPDAGHSFLNDAPNGPRVLRPLLRVAHVGPEPASAADAWARIEAFFDRYLRSAEPDLSSAGPDS